MPLTSHHFLLPVATQPLPAARMGLALWVMGMPGAVALAHTAPPAWLVTLAEGASVQTLGWVATLGLGIMLVLAIGLGLKLGPQVGLSTPLIHAAVEGRIPWRGMRVLSLPGVAGGVIGAAWLVTLAVVWPESMSFVDPVYGLPLLPKILYGSFTEELLLRFGMLSLVMWLLWKAFGSPKRRPGWLLGWSAIAIAALLSAGIPVYLGWTVTGTMSAAVVAQLLVCEIVYGLLAGVMFWRYGLESAMLTHLVTYLLSHGLI